ncbi:hypothetical protein HDE77_000084 [Rhodanobacter sp. MP7CTX1]|nr:hypothetical protein [Rhodanobacter sp. MP7CTX1]
MDEHQACIRWERIRLGENTMGPWYARLPSRDGVCFATISECLDSRWVVNLFPKGRDVAMWSCYVPTGEKGKVWIERWTRHHWQSVTSSPTQ